MSDRSLMHAAGESHRCVVPGKAPNKDPRGSAEDPEGAPEGRRSIKQNTPESNPRRPQRRETGSGGLDGVPEAAKRDTGLRFCILIPWGEFAPNIRDKNRVR